MLIEDVNPHKRKCTPTRLWQFIPGTYQMEVLILSADIFPWSAQEIALAAHSCPRRK